MNNAMGCVNGVYGLFKQFPIGLTQLFIWPIMLI